MSVNDVYKATVEFTAPNASGIMSFNIHYRTTTVVSPISSSEEATEIAQTLINNIDLFYIPHLADSLTQTVVTVIGISQPTTGVTVANNQVGLLNEGNMSYRNAPVVKLSTGLRGRSFNGRLYLMAPTEMQQSGGVLDPAYVTILDDFMGAIRVMTGLPSNNVYSMTIYSPTLTGDGPVIDNLVTGRAINPKSGTQRSRQDVA